MERDQREGSIASSSSLYQSDSDRSTAFAEERQSVKRQLETEDAAPEKKRKLNTTEEGQAIPSSQNRIKLPTQLWQEIFLYLDPITLGKLASTTKTFNFILTQSSIAQEPLPGRLQLQPWEDVWRRSRRIHRPLMPKPIPGRNEIEMWALIGGKRCEFCQKVGQPRTSPPSLWEGGPGQHGIRIIWPFAIRCCGECLRQRTETEPALFLSSASILQSALPFAFVTESVNVIASSAISARPPELQITKWYYKPHIENMKKELEHARSLGQAAAEEWLKGLPDRGKESMKDSARWETFEIKGGFSHVFSQPVQADLTQVADHYPVVSNAPYPYNNPGNYTPYNAYNGYPSYTGYPSTSYVQPWTQAPVHPHPYGYQPYYSSYTQPQQTPHVPQVPQVPQVLQVQQIPQTPQVQVLPPQPVPLPAAHSLGKNSRDAIEAKQARKSEIERRCAELEDPIPPNVLQHMDSFRAACQISAPMTDNAWEVLKPRLLGQRDAAEQIEVQRQQNLAALQVKIEDRRQRDTNQKEIKEALDREWDDSQKPIRTKLSKYADEVIKNDWLSGRSVTKENSAAFASDVLSKVRARFYNDIAREDEAARAAGRKIKEDPPNGPPTRKLVLENMKWVFDHKIKSITEQYRKELFLCNGEGCEGNFKFYGFEGVIQHYGAKHTNQFSKGNIIVHWQSAEWPEDPPFHPDPAAAKESYYAGQSVSGSGPFGDAFTRGATITPQVGAQGPFGYPPMTPGHTNGSSTSSYPGVQHAQGWSQHTSPQTSSRTLSHQPYDTYSTFTSQSMLSPRRNTRSVDLSQLAVFGGSAKLPEDDNSLDADRIDELAGDAKYFWNFLSNVKELSDTVRIYVVLHHVISQFKTRSGIEPDLNIFGTALETHPSMEPLQSASGLVCRSLVQNGMAAIRPGNSHSLASFLSLLKSVYTEQFSHEPRSRDALSGPSLRWAKDMIMLPEAEYISNLMSAPGMDDDKLHIVAVAFPGLFPKPLPRIGLIKDPEQAQMRKEVDELLDNLVPHIDPTRDNKSLHSSNGQPQDTDRTNLSSRAGNIEGALDTPSSRKSPVPPIDMEDEYDPTHPATQSSAKAFARSQQQKRIRPEDFEDQGRARSRHYVEREVYDDRYDPLPPDQYVRGVPMSPGQSRTVRYIYEERPDVEYVPIARDYARVASTSPRMYYREPAVRVATNASRLYDNEHYVRVEPRGTSRTGYGSAERYFGNVGSEERVLFNGRNGDGFRRQEPQTVTRDHTVEADAGFRALSHMPSEAPAGPIPVPIEGGPQRTGSLASIAPTPVPPAPASTDGSEGPPPREILRVTNPDPGYRGRSTLPEPRYVDQHGRPIRTASHRDDPYEHAEAVRRNRGGKYGRYDAQRRRLQHDTSQSPPPRAYTVVGEPARGVQYYREPEMYYEDRRYVRVDDRAYSPPVVRYLPGERYIDEYERPVVYVRDRDPYAREPRYVSSARPGEPEYVEYASPRGAIATGVPLDGRHYVQTERTQNRREREPKPREEEVEEDDYEPPSDVGLAKA